jgi:arginine decarboxylase
LISAEILEYLLALDVKEIHGYNSELGLRIFTAAALAEAGGNEPALPKPAKKKTSRAKSTKKKQ